jgi:LAO/AO transport system kinase
MDAAVPHLDLEKIAAGGKPALARAMGELERRPEAAAVVGLLDRAFAAARAHVVGLTGPPGVGKSTLLAALIARFRARGRTVAALAVDPSSRRSGGALLGDRLRLRTDPGDAGCFVRSMAARDRLGGLAPETVAAMVLLRALYDVVFVETVGVGQSEADVAEVADTVVLCVQPGSGDALQFMKAGIVEIPDLCVVTKADMGAAARRAAADLEAALDLAACGAAHALPVLLAAAARDEGVAELADALEERWARLAGSGDLALRRRRQAEAWLAAAVRERFGREGLSRAGAMALGPGRSPFAEAARIAADLSAGPAQGSAQGHAQQRGERS